MVPSNYKLKSITIKGFKSIAYNRPITLHFDDTTILIGANGSGKSNIISFFKMISYMMNGTLRQYIAQYGTNQLFLHYGPKITPAIDAEIRFEGHNAYDTYRFTLGRAVDQGLVISREEIEWKSDGMEKPSVFQLIPKSLFETTISQAHSKEPTKTVWNLLSGCKPYQFCDSTEDSALRQASTVDSALYLQSRGNNLAAFLLYLRDYHPDSYERIVRYVNVVLPQFRDFYLEPIGNHVSLKWVDRSGNDYVFIPHQFSDGTIRFVALATLLLQPAKTMPRIIVLDEPELGLHPYAIDQLKFMIKDASKHAQVIIATQSPSLLDGFSANDVTVVEYDEEENCTIARQLNSDDYTEWIARYSMSELWNKNVFGGRPV